MLNLHKDSTLNITMQDPGLDLCLVKPAVNVIFGDNWGILGEN